VADEDHKETLDAEVNHTIRESRMVLPGIQALFGFQMIAVFNPQFSRALPLPSQLLHLGATALVVCAIALIMAPAAYHRLAEPDRLSRYFADYASAMVSIAMVPLVAALAIELSVICYLVLRSAWLAGSVGITVGLILASLWFVYPTLRSQLRKRRQAHP
jgi:Family of unknown function (DUF6328)